MAHLDDSIAGADGLDLMSMHVNDLDLPNRARNCLRRARVTAVAELVRRTRAQLLAMPNMGRTTVGDVERALNALGLRLRMAADGVTTPTESPPPPRRQPPDEAINGAAARKAMSMRIDELSLSIRAFNCLRHAEINSVAALVQKTPSELMAIRHMGRTSVRDIERALAAFGLQLGMTAPAVSALLNIDFSEVDDCDAFLEVMQLLARSGIHTSEVIRMTSDELLALPGLDFDALRAIENGLERWGLHLRPSSLPHYDAAQPDQPNGGNAPFQTGEPQNGPQVAQREQPETVAREMALAVVDVLKGARGVSAGAFIAYHGVDGQPRRTLREIGAAGGEYGFARPVTRERVRQVLEKTEGRLRRRTLAGANRPAFALWQTAMENIQGRLPISSQSFTSSFGYGSSHDSERIFGMLKFCAGIFRLKFPCDLRAVAGMGTLVVASDDRGQLALAGRLQAAARGPYGDLAEVAGRIGVESDSVARIVDASSQWEFLDNARQYFWKRPTLPPVNAAVTGNPILTSLCKVFSVATHASSMDLSRSIPRDRMFRKGRKDGPVSSLPLSVLEGIAEKSGLFRVDGGQITKAAKNDWCVVGERDAALLTICAKHGRVVPSRVLYAGLVRSGLTRENAVATVAYSPFLVHTKSGVGYREGIYKFVVRPEDIDLDGLKSSERLDDGQNAGNDPDSEGMFVGSRSEARVTVLVSSRTRLSGSHFAPKPVGLDGEWDVQNRDGANIGRVAISGQTISGLAPVVEALRLERDDVLEMCFDTERGFATGQSQQ